MLTKDELPVRLTEQAKEEILRRIAQLKLGHPVLRIGVKKVGAQGVDYLLAFDKAEPRDHYYQDENWDWVISPKDMMFVLGMNIDYAKLGNQLGFVFRK